MNFINNKQNVSNQGFTLIEVIIAIAVLTIGILSLYSMHVSAINGNATANNLTTRSSWASDRIELLLNNPYDDYKLKDKSPEDGTNQDANNDGVDDNGGNFGLDNATPATADGTDTSPDGQFTIFWNVAVDIPVKHTKTIRVIVTSQDRGVTKTVPMTYIKADKI